MSVNDADQTSWSSRFLFHLSFDIQREENVQRLQITLVIHIRTVRKSKSKIFKSKFTKIFLQKSKSNWLFLWKTVKFDPFEVEVESSWQLWFAYKILYFWYHNWVVKIRTLRIQSLDHCSNQVRIWSVYFS